MKKLQVLGLVLCFVAVSAQAAINWSTPEKVNVMDGNDASNIVAAVENGKFGIAYHHFRSNNIWGTVYYNEYTYTPGTLGVLTHAITDESLPKNAVSTYGIRIAGMGFANGQPVIGTAAWSAGNTNARVYTRTGKGAYEYVDASTNVLYSGCARREAFKLDSMDKPYYVYTDTTGISGNDIVMATAASSTAATGSWTETILSTPEYPLTTAAAKVAIDKRFGSTVQTAYMASHEAYPPGWFTADGTTTYDTTLTCGTVTSKCDIEIGADGNPMVAAFSGGGVTVAFYDGVSSYITTVVTAETLPQKIGWYNTADHVDLEVNAHGRPVVLVARANNDDSDSITSTDLEYYAYESGTWTGGVILTVPQAGGHISNPDLAFDESGRAFITYSAKVDGATNRDVYVMTEIPEPGIIILLASGVLGVAIRLKKEK